MKITKVYTKTGDTGTTSLVGGIRIDKASVRLEAYGTVDELSSHLGLLASMIKGTDDAALIERIQNTLFNICSYLATDRTQTPVYASAKLDIEEITILEENIDIIMQTLPTLHSFVLPGGTMAASQCHVCRTVCRRAERRIVALIREIECDSKKLIAGENTENHNASSSDNQDNDVLKYINRLSDYLFVLARKININEKEEEKIWKKTCK